MEASGLLEDNGFTVADDEPHTVTLFLKEGVDDATAVTRLEQEIARRLRA